MGQQTPFPVQNIFANIKTQIDGLSWAWSDNHFPILQEFIFCVLAAKQSKTQTFKNMEITQIDVGLPTTMQIGVGRSQAVCVGAKQFQLGRPVLRTLEKSCFAMSILFLHHLKANHVRTHAKASLLKHGFVSPHLESDLKALESKCGHCIRQKSISGSEKDNIHVTTNGNFFNLGQLCNNPNENTITCDYFGFFYGQNDKKLWALVYLSHNTGMVYIDLMHTMSLTGFLESFHCLTSTIGAVTCILSDQGSSFCSVANIYQVSGDQMGDGLPAHRQMSNPLARLLENGDISGKSGGISYRVTAANSGEMAGQIEKVVGIAKKSLRSVKFFELCHTYTDSKIRSLLCQAAATLNTRPTLQLNNGRILSPFDIINLTQLAGVAPFQSLRVHSENKDIMRQITEYENLKTNIQIEIFNKYLDHLFLDSGRRQKGNFAMDSKHLQIGDLIILREEFKKTKNFSKSIRRISHLDVHKRHCICYHSVRPHRDMDYSHFCEKYKNCHTKEERQYLAAQYFGHFSFQSVDLRKTAFVAKRDDGNNLDLFFKHSKNPWVGHPLPCAGPLDIQGMQNKLQSATAPTSSGVMDIGDNIMQILNKEFMIKEEQTQCKQESPVLIEEASVAQGEEMPQSGGTQTKTRRGRLIRKPVRLGFDE